MTKKKEMRQADTRHGRHGDVGLSDYLRKLYTFCLRETRNHADAEDLCQDIVTEIVTSATSLRHRGAISKWVWTIARRTHFRWAKQREAEGREQAALLQDSVGASYVCPINALLETEQTQQLGHEIGLLSRTHREVIVQHYLHEKTCAEIAAMMDISESMVKYHLVCARRKIKEGVTMERKQGTTSYAPEEFAYIWWRDESYPDIALNYRPLTLSIHIADKLHFALSNPWASSGKSSYRM